MTCAGFKADQGPARQSQHECWAASQVSDLAGLAQGLYSALYRDVKDTINGARTFFASSLTRLLHRHVTASSATASPPAPSAAAPEQQQAAPVLPFRVGYGFDLHRLVEGKKLIICGIDVPHVRGCDAHSDGGADLHCTNQHAKGCWKIAWNCRESKSTAMHVTHAS